jgi:hypothetical protein
MDPVLDLVVRGGLTLLLAAAALHKLADPARFRATLGEYRVLPAPAVGVASALVVGTELVLAVALLVPATRTVGLLAGAALLAVYAAAIAVNLLRGRTDLDCGCLASGGGRAISWWLVGRNVALAALATASVAPAAARPLGWIDAVTFVGALTTTALSWVAMDGLLANRAGVARIRGAA